MHCLRRSAAHHGAADTAAKTTLLTKVESGDTQEAALSKCDQAGSREQVRGNSIVKNGRPKCMKFTAALVVKSDYPKRSSRSSRVRAGCRCAEKRRAVVIVHCCWCLGCSRCSSLPSRDSEGATVKIRGGRASEGKRSQTERIRWGTPQLSRTTCTSDSMSAACTFAHHLIL